MRIKSKIICGIIGAASLLASSSVFADIGTGSLYITAPGFSATGDQAGPYTVSSLVAVTGQNPGASFQTFCIGSQVDYNPNASYNYQISDTVQPASGVGSPGYVTWGTAWLYSQYRAGNIGDGTANDGRNDALQGLIWCLQGQSLSGVTFHPDSSYYNTLLTDVNNAALAANRGVGSDANGAFGVYSLNLLSGSTYVQPQLCIVPVPEPTTYIAGGLMLLPFLAGVLRNARKRSA